MLATTFTEKSSIVAANLIHDGSFDTPDLNGVSGSLDGWSTFNEDNSHGALRVQTPNAVTGTSVSPISLVTMPAPPVGQFAAMLDQADVPLPGLPSSFGTIFGFGPASAFNFQPYDGMHLLYQDISVPANTSKLTLSLDLAWNSATNFTDTTVNPNLDFSTAKANQQVRVDIMDPSANLSDVGAGVLQSLFVTTPNSPLIQAYTPLTFDLSALANHPSIRLRIAEVNNSKADPTAGNNTKLVVGVDGVNLKAVFNDTAAPTISGLQLRNPGFGATTNPAVLTFGAASGSATLAYAGVASPQINFSPATTAGFIQANLATIPALSGPGAVVVSGNPGGPFTINLQGGLNVTALTVNGQASLATPQSIVATLTSAGSIKLNYDGVTGAVFQTTTGTTALAFQNYLQSITGLVAPGAVSVTGNPGGPFTINLASGLSDSLLSVVSGPIQLQAQALGTVASFAGFTSDPTFIGQVYDNGTNNNIKFLQISTTDPVTGLPINSKLTSWDATGHFTFTLPVSVPGQYSVNVQAVDRAGNLFSQPVTFTLQGASLSNWQARGPGQILTTGVQYATVSGRVTAIVVDPRDNSGNTFYIGAANGGVWRTTDGGQDYTPLTDFVFDSSGNPVSTPIGGLAISHSNPNVLYAGLGVADASMTRNRAAASLKRSTAGSPGTCLARQSSAAPVSRRWQWIRTIPTLPMRRWPPPPPAM